MGHYFSIKQASVEKFEAYDGEEIRVVFVLEENNYICNRVGIQALDRAGNQAGITWDWKFGYALTDYGLYWVYRSGGDITFSGTLRHSRGTIYPITLKVWIDEVGGGEVWNYMDDQRSFTVESRVVVTVKTEGQGTVNSGGQPFVGIIGRESWFAGKAADGWHLQRWEVEWGLTPYREPDIYFRTIQTIMVIDDFTIKAFFAQDEVTSYTVQCSANPSSYGNVSIGSAVYPAGTEVLRYAWPNPGYRFLNWTCTPTDLLTAVLKGRDDIYFYMPASNVALAANFGVLTSDPVYNVSATASAGGTASASPTSGIAGTVVAATAEANTGYTFAGWTCTPAGLLTTAQKAAPSISFYMPASNVALAANFTSQTSPGKYKLTVAVSPANSGSVTGAGDYAIATPPAQATVVANNAANYKFARWETSPALAYATGYSATMVTSKVLMSVSATITAVFVPVTVATFTVTVDVTPTDAGLVTGNGNYETGAQASLKASPKTGYKFKEWLVGTTKVATTPVYTFAVTGNVTVKAVFEEETETPSWVIPAAIGLVGLLLVMDGKKKGAK